MKFTFKLNPANHFINRCKVSVNKPYLFSSIFISLFLMMCLGPLKKLLILLFHSLFSIFLTNQSTQMFIRAKSNPFLLQIHFINLYFHILCVDFFNLINKFYNSELLQNCWDKWIKIPFAE